MYGFIVFSLSYENPIECRALIEADLANSGYIGKILFDLFSANGNTSNRYFEMFFNGRRFDLKSGNIASSTIPSELKDYCDDFYASHPELNPSRFDDYLLELG